MNNLPLSRLQTFEVAARHLSFTKAAEELHITQGAISQQIRQLEDQLGFKLFVRNSARHLELTGEGRRLVDTVINVLSELRFTIHEIQDDGATGDLRVSVGPSLAMKYLIPALGDFHKQHSNIRVQIESPDYVGGIEEQVANFDLAIRFGKSQSRDVEEVPLVTEQVFVVCSPSLLESLDSIDQLSQYTLLRNGMSERELDGAGDWATWFKLFGHADVSVVGFDNILFARSDMVVQAAIHGQGMALVWDTMVRRELKLGELIKPFQGQFEYQQSYFAVASVSSMEKKKVRVFLDWAKNELEQIADRNKAI